MILDRMKTCEMGLVKYLLFGFNLLFAISGIGIIIAGALVLGDLGEYRHFMEGRILAPPVVLIVAGCIVFLVASLGCYGAIRESYWMLMAFAVCLLIIFIIELSVGIAAAVYQSELEEGLKQRMRESLEKYDISKNDATVTAWDNLQTELKCCGIDGFTDWERKRPSSCCYATREGAPTPSPQQCLDAQSGQDYLHSDGCLKKIYMKAHSAGKVLIGVGIGIAFVEIIGIILACWLASAIKKRS